VLSYKTQEYLTEYAVEERAKDMVLNMAREGDGSEILNNSGLKSSLKE